MSESKQIEMLEIETKAIYPELTDEKIHSYAFNNMSPNYIQTLVKRNVESTQHKGLKTLGYESVRPTDYVNGKMKSSVFDYDISNTTSYDVRFKFVLNNRDFHIDLQLPFPRDYGLIQLSGAPYTVNQVIDSPIISKSLKGLFIRLLGYRGDIEYVVQSVDDSDGNRYDIDVVHANNFYPSKRGIGVKLPVLSWYLYHNGIAKYMSTYCKGESIIISTDKEMEGYITFSSENYVPRLYMKKPFVMNMYIHIKTKKLSRYLKSLIGTLFYMVQFCQVKNKELIQSLSHSMRLKNNGLEKIVIRDIIARVAMADEAIQVDKDSVESFNSNLDNYLNSDDIAKLEMNDMIVDDIRELFVDLNTNFNKRLERVKEANILDGALGQNFYVYNAYIMFINMLFRAFNKRKTMSMDTINKDIKKLRPNTLLYKLNGSASGLNIALTPFSGSSITDMAFFTNQTAKQEYANNNVNLSSSKKKGAVTHIEQPEAASAYITGLYDMGASSPNKITTLSSMLTPNKKGGFDLSEDEKLHCQLVDLLLSTNEIKSKY